MILGCSQKAKYQEILFTKSVSKILIPNCVCVFTNKRHRIYRPEFSFCDLGHTLGVGIVGAGGH